MHSDAWKVAHALAHEACNRDGSRQGAKRQPYSLLMCIVSRMSLFAESTREVEEIKDLSKSFASFVVLEPFDEPARLKYLYDVLRKRHGFEGELTDLPQHLIRYVSETAAGVPKHIENLVAALFDKEQLRIEIADAAAGGHKSLVTADPESLANTPVPAKIRAAAVRSYENLTPRHQLLIKLFSPLDAFSIRMIQGLLQRMMTEKKTSGVDYEHVKTDIEDLKKQQCAERPSAGFPRIRPRIPRHASTPRLSSRPSILEELPGNALPLYITTRDPTAKAGYRFKNKQMQREVRAYLLAEERQAVEEHAEDLRLKTDDARQREMMAAAAIFSDGHLEEEMARDLAHRALTPNERDLDGGEYSYAKYSPPMGRPSDYGASLAWNRYSMIGGAGSEAHRNSVPHWHGRASIASEPTPRFERGSVIAAAAGSPSNKPNRYSEADGQQDSKQRSTSSRLRNRLGFQKSPSKDGTKVSLRQLPFSNRIASAFAGKGGTKPLMTKQGAASRASLEPGGSLVRVSARAHDDEPPQLELA